MRPMLARTLGPRFDKYPCYIQPKLNGVRALFQQGVFQSRDEKLWEPTVLSHLIAQLELIRGHLGPLILDGELYHHDWKLQRINGAIAVNRNESVEDTLQISYYVFDVVDPNKKFSDRWMDVYNALRLLDSQLPNIVAVPTDYVYFREEVEQHFHRYTKLGYEGVMLRPDGPYEINKRSKFLWKYKSWLDDEFICVGATQGEGKASIGFGALVCAGHPENYKNISIEELGKYRTFKVGTGFSDEERMMDPPIGKLVRVRYLCLTESGIPFNPSFVAVMQ